MVNVKESDADEAPETFISKIVGDLDAGEAPLTDVKGSGFGENVENV